MSFGAQLRLRLRLQGAFRADALSSAERPALARLLGGPRGLAEALIPGAVFVTAYSLTGRLKTSLLLGIGTNVLFLVARAIRRLPVLPALGGLASVTLGALVAITTGSAKNAFLPGIVASIVFALVAVASVLVRRPLVSLILAGLSPGPDPRGWLTDPTRRRACADVTLLFGGASAARALVQLPLYVSGDFTTLGVARLAMGLPLYAICAWISWLTLRTVSPAHS